MKILGINFDTHESSVALIEDDKILFVASEERYSRIKMDDSFPTLALAECLKYTKTAPAEIDIIAISGFPPFKNWFHYARSFIVRKIFARGRDFLSFERNFKGRKIVLKNFPAFMLNVCFCTGFPQFVFLYLAKRLKLWKMLRGFGGRVVYVSHHHGHVAGACFCSGFDDSLSVVTEGYDWVHSFVIDSFSNGTLTTVAATPWPHSPGAFYRLVTAILGFDYLKHAGKVMGLAASGDPNVLYDKVSALLWSEKMQMKVSPLVFSLYQEYLVKNRLPDYFFGHSREDIAAAFQKRLEDVTVEIIKQALSVTQKKKIALSGGVAGNVLMNQKIHEIEGVEEIYVHPAMSDSGQALGAALYAYNEELKRQGTFLHSQRLSNVYFGSGYSHEEIRMALLQSDLTYEYYEDIEKEIARLLSEKKVVARFNGRMEYGPRALGNRSILFHTGDNTVNDWLNKKLVRTEFMPFAPSVLAEDQGDFFLDGTGAEYAGEFMTITFNCTEKMKRECPAVVHIDGTARPHLVTRQGNPSYYRIIDEYKKISGIGVILNTSFNMHEEPIVCSPHDAIRAFLRGHLDYLALGNWIVNNNR